MDRISADSFVFAKASALFARSYIGNKAKSLLEIKRIQDIWTLLFKEEVPLVPEGMLALQLERKAQSKKISQVLSLLDSYDKPDPVTLALLAQYDYNNLKAIASSVALGLTEMPHIVDLGKYSLFNYNAWPNIEQITANSPVSWYNRVPSIEEQVSWEVKLDHAYYHNIWEAFLSLSKKDQESCFELISQEIILQNVVWALRLRVNYDFTSDAIKPMLALYGTDLPQSAQLYEPALEILDLPIDSWAAWQKWKYRWILNPHEEGVPWLLDPRWAQMAGDKHLYKIALRNFRRYPFTVGVLVSFFTLKQLEYFMIQVATEGLRLGASEQQMFEYMGDPRNA